MLVGLLKGTGKSAEKNYSRYIEVLKHNQIDYKEIDLNSKSFFKHFKEIDYLVYRWTQRDDDKQIASSIRTLFDMNPRIKVFPDNNTCWHFDNKISQSYLLESKSYPLVDSWIFWDKVNALNFIKNCNYPLIFKLSGGAGSCNVLLLKNYNDAKKIVNIMFDHGVYHGEIPVSGNLFGNILFKKIKDCIKKYLLRKKQINSYRQLQKGYVLFQKYLPGNDFDTRITIIGDKAFGFRRFNRDGDFRASGSGKIDYNNKNIDLKCVEVAFEISKELGFQSMAFDFLKDGNVVKICEISYTYNSEAIFKAPGYWDINLCWNQGHFWPEYLHLKGLLNLEKLKQPKM